MVISRKIIPRNLQLSIAKICALQVVRGEIKQFFSDFSFLIFLYFLEQKSFLFLVEKLVFKNFKQKVEKKQFYEIG